jgi:hypothetical protein
MIDKHTLAIVNIVGSSLDVLGSHQRHGLPPELLQNIAVVETLAAAVAE